MASASSVADVSEEVGEDSDEPAWVVALDVVAGRLYLGPAPVGSAAAKLAACVSLNTSLSAPRTTSTGQVIACVRSRSRPRLHIKFAKCSGVILRRSYFHVQV